MEKYINNSCQVICRRKDDDDELGSGFYVSPTQIVTAAHVLLFADDGDKAVTVRVYKRDGVHNFFAKANRRDDSPLAILKIEESADFNPVTFLARFPDAKEQASAYGFPEAFPSGYNADFIVNHQITDESEAAPDANIVLDFDSHTRIKSIKGMSGAALIVDEEIAGILLQETATDGTAIVAHALAGPKFREELLKWGITPPVSTPAPIPSSPEVSTYELLNEQRLLRTEINQRLSKDLDRIVLLRSSGQVSSAWEELTSAIQTIDESHASDEQKAAYYYLAAIWSLEEQNSISDNYLNHALSYYHELDTRIYLSEKALKERDIARAINILAPIDSIAILNQKAKCLCSNGDYDEVIREYSVHPEFSPNCLSSELLALSNLAIGAYENALRVIENQLCNHPSFPSLLRIKGIIHCEMALKEIGVRLSDFRCVFVNPYYFKPTRAQQNLLKDAMSDFQNAMDKCELSKEREWFYAAILSIATILPSEDELRWLWKMEEEYPVSSLAIYYRAMFNKGFSDKQAEGYLALDNGHSTYAPTYYQAKFYLLKSLGRFEEAAECLEIHEWEISSGDEDLLQDLQFHIALDRKDFRAARNIASRESDLIARERFNLAVDVSESKRTSKKIASSLIGLARKSQLPMDYNNAYQYLKKSSNWNKALQMANEWYKVDQSLAVLLWRAEALTNYGRETKALQLIERIEKEGYLSPEVLRIKVRCLHRLSRLDEVLDLIESVKIEEQDYELVLDKANAFIIRGEVDSAIKCLRSYVDKGFKNKTIYEKLIALLETDDLNMAFSYLMKMKDAYPEDKRILQKYCLAGAISGNHVSAEEWTEAQKLIASDYSFVKSYTVEEAIKIIDEIKENAAQMRTSYYNLKIPLCALSDKISHGEMSLRLFFQWKLGLFGSAPALCANNISNFVPEAGAKIVLDFAAIAAAFEMGILSDACKRWQCRISPGLTSLILNEIKAHNSIQLSQEKENKQLLRDFDKSRINFVQPPSMPTTATVYDCLVALAAENNFIIVSNGPSEQIHLPVPNGWEQFSISLETFRLILQEKKIYSFGIDPNATDIKSLLSNPSRGFLLDVAILHELSERGILGITADSIDIYVLSAHYAQTKSKVNQFRYQRETVSWLKCIQDELRKLILYGDIILMEQPSRTSKAAKMDELPATSLLIHELELSAKHKAFLWIDDRVMMKERAPFVIGTVNILHALYADDRQGLYLKMDTLFEKHIGNFLPDVDYWINRLELCPTNEETHELIESATLKNIRETICFTLYKSDEPLLSAEKIPPFFVSERNMYVALLYTAFQKTMQRIWAASQSENWKIAASSWMMDKFFPLLYDSCGTTGQYIAPARSYAVLIMIGGTVEYDTSKIFYKWLRSYLVASWKAAPEEELQTAVELSEYIIRQSGSDLTRVWIEIIYNNLHVWSFTKKFFSQSGIEDKVPPEYMRMVKIWTSVPTNMVIVEKLQQENLEGVLQGNLDDEETVLYAVSTAPSLLGSETIKFLEKATETELTNLRTQFLSTLYWYVSAELKYRVRCLYLNSVMRHISAEHVDE